MNNDGDWLSGALFTGTIVFIGSWIYCIATYGYLLGVGLGWLPSIIVAVIAGFLWPFVVLGILVLVVLGVLVLAYFKFYH